MKKQRKPGLKTFLLCLALTGCMSEKPTQAPCPPPPLQTDAAAAPAPELKGHRLITLSSPTLNAFSQAPSTPFYKLQNTLQNLRYDTGTLPLPALSTQPLGAFSLTPKAQELLYLLTDLSGDTRTLTQSMYSLIQNNGAVGLLSVASPYQGRVSTAAGDFNHSGPRRLYLLVLGTDYDHVEKALNLLRDHPTTRAVVKAPELTIFVKQKLRQVASFPEQSALDQARARLNELDKHPVLKALHVGMASSEAAVNRSLQLSPEQVSAASTYLKGYALPNKRLPYLESSCDAPHSQEIEIKNDQKTLGIRQLFTYSPREYAPRIKAMYTDRSTGGLSLNELQPGQKAGYKPTTVSGSIETTKAFAPLWDKPETPIGSAPAGSPFDTQDPIGMVYIQFNELEKLLTNRVYHLGFRLYPSKTGQGSGESATKFFSTPIPVSSWNLSEQQAQSCRSGGAFCGQTAGFENLYEQLLKACVPFNETTQQRETLAEFNYYLKRKS